MAIVKSGVNIVVDGLDNFGSIDVDTDNLVIWTDRPLAGDADGQRLQPKDRPLEIYMEGNVVFRQGERTIYAQRMYYDVRRETGIVLAAEVLTPVESFEGMLQLRADVVQQTRPRSLHRPKRLAHLQPLRRARLRAALGPDDLRRHPAAADQSLHRHARGRRHRRADHRSREAGHQPQQRRLHRAVPGVLLAVHGHRIWSKPNFYIDVDPRQERPGLRHAGAHRLDAYQLLGMRNPPPGTKWTISTDYLSKRGPAGGTTFNYERQTLFGVPESTSGFVDAWGINDHGLDNLGFDRRDLIPPDKISAAACLAQHRQLLPDNFQLTGEVGPDQRLQLPRTVLRARVGPAQGPDRPTSS